jgi:L-amino acid N-acyltransferase YncA
MRAADWPLVRRIFEEGIATGNATFETSAPDWNEWDEAHLKGCRLTARRGANDICGWAALSAVSERCIYAGVAEVSIYVASQARGAGIGRELLARLIAQSEATGLWTLQAGIFPENEASLRLFRDGGFRDVGRRERLGQLAGKWRDVLLLERRSPRVGN